MLLLAMGQSWLVPPGPMTFVGCVEESDLQTGFIVLPYQGQRPMAHISVKAMDVFNLSKKKKRREVHIDLWTPVLLLPLGHSCEIVPPRLKLRSHTLCSAAVCWERLGMVVLA